MISPNLTTKEKALAGVIFLRKCAEVLANTENPMLRISAEPYCIAADAIEQIVEENEKLREQLVAFQRASASVSKFDPIGDAWRTRDTNDDRTPFVRGDRVRLKLTPEKHGTVDITRGDDSGTLSCFVHFAYPPEKHSWVSAKLLELIPDE